MGSEIISAILGALYVGARTKRSLRKEKEHDRRYKSLCDAAADYDARFQASFFDSMASKNFSWRLRSEFDFEQQVIKETKEIFKIIPGAPQDWDPKYITVSNGFVDLVGLVHFANIGKAYHCGIICGGTDPLGLPSEQARAVMRWARDRLRETMPDCNIYIYSNYGLPEYTWCPVGHLYDSIRLV